ncbi:MULTISPECIES: hypothetical protein [unclassified Aureimonas]|uniref:hypothetical protein n=1 Tax=unclassified Aureimonas TaxID=2615206 RepID=UPI0006F4121A|nr:MULTISPECIES: hypothetical protein [unclassified Aureimonas]KQT60549.1 hypothetical protein ASG62_07875 [Aureimonas sp. Leaf427]KQT79426.1 hypothetical protein ASG54_10475 [Aureimonas sp. Leaf460]
MKGPQTSRLDRTEPDGVNLDARSLEAIAEQAIANGWPAFDVATTVADIVGPVSAPVHPLQSGSDLPEASSAVHRIFSEAAKRLAET